jgi:1,2-diacylglycerol 3-alpha-glucosyltransferase
MKRLLLEYGVKRTKPIYILPTGINLKMFKKSKKEGLKVRKKLKISPRAKILIFVGRMGKEKNPEFLLRVMSEILKKRKNVILLMIGDGPYLKELQKIAQKLKIENNVIFTGAIPHKRIPTCYQASDIFVFSSLTDTQGIVILEAMACGLPVVALKDDAFKEMVVDNKNGFLIKKSSPEIFAKRVLEIVAKISLYKKLSIASHRIARDFSKENQAKKLLKIYKSLIKG